MTDPSTDTLCAPQRTLSGHTPQLKHVMGRGVMRGREPDIVDLNIVDFSFGVLHHTRKLVAKHRGMALRWPASLYRPFAMQGPLMSRCRA
jgi:hypothetical protein